MKIGLPVNVCLTNSPSINEGPNNDCYYHSAKLKKFCTLRSVKFGQSLEVRNEIKRELSIDKEGAVV
jgi:hypothetical protein